jgi:S1-C subfamily serine protease
MKKSLFLIILIGGFAIFSGLQFGLGIKRDRYFTSAEPSPPVSQPNISPIPTLTPNNLPTAAPSPIDSLTKTPTSIESPLLTPKNSPSPSNLPTPTSTPNPSSLPDSPLITPNNSPSPSNSPTPISTPTSTPTPNPTLTPTPNPTSTPNPSSLPLLKPKEIARQIVVKIGIPDLIGSGTIVSENNGTYTVLTNAHVLRSANPPYRVTTADRAIHNTKVFKNTLFKNRDLAILQFKAKPNLYQVAQISSLKNLKIGDRLYVGGFTKQGSERDRDDFVWQEGATSIVLNKSIEEGYRLGYTNKIYRGMSGSPVVDSLGRVVGINGLLNNPVWLTRSRFSDGSSPCEPLQLLIDKSSLAIPIDDIIPLTNKLFSFRSSPTISQNLPAENTNDKTQRKALEISADRALRCQ